MKRRTMAVILAVLSVLAIGTGNVLAVGTLDQSQANTSGTVIKWTNSNIRLAQTFTVGKTGTLDTVDIYASGYGSTATFEMLGGSYLDTQTITFASRGWTRVTLATPFHVKSGAWYYIILAPNGNIFWGGDCTNIYAGGEAEVLDFSIDGAYRSIPAYAALKGKTGYCIRDFAFKTYVTADATPTPVATPTPKVTAVAKTAVPHASAAATASPAATAADATAGDSSSPDASAADESPFALDTAGASASEPPLIAAASQPAGSASPAPASGSGGSGDSGSLLPVLLLLLVGAAVVGGGIYFFVLKRRKRDEKAAPGA